MIKIFTILIGLMVITGMAWSDTIRVPDDYPTIQEGIDAAVDGDIVLVADGTYTVPIRPDDQNYIDTLGKAIIVTSENGPDNTIIDCEASPEKVARAFAFQNEEGPDTVVSGFTMTGGYKPNGGAIFCKNYTSPTIKNNIITGNIAEAAGGAIICQFSSPMIIDNIIENNHAGNFGGGITCYSYSDPTIKGNIIRKNSAGIDIPGGPGNGGGIFVQNYSFPQITNNVIIGNSAANYGGGFCSNVTGTSSLDEQSGFVRGEDNGEIINNLIAENSAGVSGGGIFSSVDYSPIITYNTITSNSAASGGGIYSSQGDAPTVLNSIFWNNSPEEIFLSPTSSITVDYSDVQGGEAGIGGDPIDVNWGEGNIDTDPLFVDPANSNYYLQTGSPCLNSADCAGTTVTTDIDGHPRPLGNGCDMGCYEHCDGGLIYGDVSWNCSVTAFDASLVLGYVVGSIRDLSKGQLLAADVTGNKIVSALDAARILQYTVGIITTFSAENSAGAPILNAKSESELLADAIGTLETISLDKEQEDVVKQLKYFLVGSIPLTHTTLLQNYPNPFNPETWLPYQLTQDMLVTIRIYNAKGQFVRSLQLGMKKAGSYIRKDGAAYWDGRDNLGQKVASGVYFYTLLAGEYIETRRMVILK